MILFVSIQIEGIIWKYWKTFFCPIPNWSLGSYKGLSDDDAKPALGKYISDSSDRKRDFLVEFYTEPEKAVFFVLDFCILLRICISCIWGLHPSSTLPPLTLKRTLFSVFIFDFQLTSDLSLFFHLSLYFVFVLAFDAYKASTGFPLRLLWPWDVL